MIELIREIATTADTSRYEQEKVYSSAILEAKFDIIISKMILYTPECKNKYNHHFKWIEVHIICKYHFVNSSSL